MLLDLPSTSKGLRIYDTKSINKIQHQEDDQYTTPKGVTIYDAKKDSPYTASKGLRYIQHQKEKTIY